MSDRSKNNDRNRKKPILALVLLIIFFCMIWTWVPVTERISINMPGITETGVRIALITDLHSCYYGKDQKWLIERIDRERPDIVILAGDIFDDKLDDKNAKITLTDLADRYPCFYVTGNHEFWSGRADEMKAFVRNADITVLEGDCSSVEVSGVTLDICGVDDPDGVSKDMWTKQLDDAFAKTDSSHIRVLVSHRPEKVSAYQQYGFDLILTGHAHSGQFRIPFINKGILAPDQGFMAEYVNGIYMLPNGSIMEVSRGLARESTPLPRFFNHPEVVLLVLEKDRA